MAGRLEGKVALVFGAGSSGPGWSNGKATSIAYAREGAALLCVDRVHEAAEETASLIQAEGLQAIAIDADVTDEHTTNRVRDAVMEAHGRVNILHNNVGIATVGGPTDVAPEDWQRTLDINLTGAFLTCRAFLPLLEESGHGSVINVSSVASQVFLGFAYSPYAASKAALEALTRDIALTYATRNVRANCILPGLMDTPMVRGQLTEAYGGDEEAMLARRNGQVPMERMGDAWDVAHAAVFLASDEARYITGQSLVVDGGLSLTIRGG